MLSDYQISQWVVKTYTGPDGFTTYDHGSIDGICWATLRFEGVTYVFLRGSVTAADWLKDAQAIADPFSHDLLGPCHPGFYIGMHELWAEIEAKTTGPWVLAGHSLGAGRCDILGAIMILDKQPPLRTVLFGEPKPGFQKLAGIWSGMPRASYRNGDSVHHDPITDVPYSIPPEEFVHPTPLVLVTAMPPDSINQRFGVFAWHHAPLYEQALCGMSGLSPSRSC